VNITFRLLYNGHISMTGGQRPEGDRGILKLVQYLSAEGVSRTIVVTESPESFRSVSLPATAAVYGRERHDDAVRELRATRGTTVLVFDQECALEKRRARKRGQLPEPEKFVVINEDVCEGCGDCGRVSNCMSVVPIETELGRRTQIHQASCNKDYSCLQGDCPSFVTVYSRQGLRKPAVPPLAAAALAVPERRVEVAESYRVFMPGVGGTGVITVSHVLAYAALLDGLEVDLLGQTGLAQKGGSVLSSVTLRSGRSGFAASRIPAGKADLVLAFDPVGLVAPYNADRMSSERTVVVGDRTVQPTADVVRHVNFLMPGKAALQLEVDRFSRASDNCWIDAGRISEQLFVDPALTNVFMLGYAFQAGLIPVSAESIEKAFVLNGAAVDRDLQAFRYGRLLRQDPDQVERLLRRPEEDEPGLRAQFRSRLGARAAEYERLLDRCRDLSPEARRLLVRRVGELIEYQNVEYAGRYVAAVLRMRSREAEVTADQDELTLTVIRCLYKLMAYKDEYEVARLLLTSPAAGRINEMFGGDARVKLNLHPPFLRNRGLRRKLELGAWFRPLLSALIPMRRLRGTPLDPFGRTEVRRAERELVVWYFGVLDAIVAGLTPDSYRSAVQLASAPDRIRGYEDIKLKSIASIKEFVERGLERYSRQLSVAQSATSAD
jgi:indolepyruvate ferredoxin oxidoreductase